MKYTPRAVDECLRALDCKVCGFSLCAEDPAYWDTHENGPEVYHADCYEDRVGYARSVLLQIADTARRDGNPMIADWLMLQRNKEGRKILRPREASGADLRKVLSEEP